MKVWVSYRPWCIKEVGITLCRTKPETFSKHSAPLFTVIWSLWSSKERCWHLVGWGWGKWRLPMLPQGPQLLLCRMEWWSEVSRAAGDQLVNRRSRLHGPHQHRRLPHHQAPAHKASCPRHLPSGPERMSTVSAHGAQELPRRSNSVSLCLSHAGST